MSIVVAMAVDPAVGQSARANYFAIATGALDVSARKFYLLDMYKARHETTEQPHVVTEQYLKWANPPGAQFYKVGIESIFAQSDLFNHIHRDGVVPVLRIERRAGTGSASLNKYFRILGLAGRYERGQIIHPGFRTPDGEWVPDYGSNPWLQDFEDEGLRLSWIDGKEQHAQDDQWDAWAMCCQMLSAFILTSYFGEPVVHAVRFGG